jgi:hypothetical protein
VIERFRLVVVLLSGLPLAVGGGCSSVPEEGGLPPSLERSIVEDPGGSRLWFQDADSRHMITLSPGGSYSFESGNEYGEVTGRRAGRWVWRQTGTHRAELTLDADLWILTFVSPESAAAVNTASGGRTHAFQFERM